MTTQSISCKNNDYLTSLTPSGGWYIDNISNGTCSVSSNLTTMRIGGSAGGNPKTISCPTGISSVIYNKDNVSNNLGLVQLVCSNGTKTENVGTASYTGTATSIPNTTFTCPAGTFLNSISSQPIPSGVSGSGMLFSCTTAPEATSPAIIAPLPILTPVVPTTTVKSLPVTTEASLSSPPPDVITSNATALANSTLAANSTIASNSNIYYYVGGGVAGILIIIVVCFMVLK